MNRKLPDQRGILVERVAKNAKDAFNKMRPDVAEMFSQPGIVRVAVVRTYEDDGYELVGPSTWRPWTPTTACHGT